MNVYSQPSDVQDEVLDDSALITTLKQIIAKEMIKPIATQTPDVSHIMPIINAAPIKVLANKATKLARRLTKTALTAALENARRKGEDTIEIHISTVSMHYDNSSVVMDLTNWTKFSTNAPSQVPTSSNKPATAAEIGQATAQAIVSSIPSAPSAQDIALAYASIAGTQGSTAAPMPSNVQSSTTSTIPGSGSSTYFSMYTFNAAILPPDVRLRFENKLNDGLILGSTVRTPYSGGYLYHEEGMDKFILSDGSMFSTANVPNEKALMKATIYCDDDSHAGIRAWYAGVTQVGFDYGFYIHPLFCFRANHGGARGFTVGNDPDDDLPRRLEMVINRMAHPLYRFLSKKEMFPKGSRLIDVVKSCEGDGYQALKAILFKSHPAFYDQPS
eukprot:scaffold1137_cov65-Cylindrotheca_fusiformis.AAC.1